MEDDHECFCQKEIFQSLEISSVFTSGENVGRYSNFFFFGAGGHSGEYRGLDLAGVSR